MGVAALKLGTDRFQPMVQDCQEIKEIRDESRQNGTIYTALFKGRLVS